MRFLRLSLERYGALTDREIRFREGARLHVAHGRNEAGKSTALAAITDLLFGFEHRTRFDFLHAGPDLRIGAEIAAKGGERLAFRRRKGKARTLIDASEAALPDDALAPFLGPVTRSVFTRAFGLSTESLREGAQDMLGAEGDIGASLFAAASGLHEPSKLRRLLEAEADDIFAPRAAKDRRFYQALERFEAARKAMREDELRGADWKALNAGIAELEGQLADIDRRRAAALGERTRLSRLRRLAPLARLRDEAAVALAALAGVPDVPPGFAERLRLALAKEEAARERSSAATQAVERVRQEREALCVDAALLRRADEIAALFAESGQYAKAREDLPGVEREAEGLRRDLEALARRLGLARAADIDRHLPSDADLTLLAALLKEGRSLDTERQGHAVALQRETQALGLLKREEAERGGATLDPEPLRERLEALEPRLRRLEQQAELSRAIGQEERAIAGAAARLDPPVAELGRLASVALPAQETMARFRRDFDRLGKALDRAREEADTAGRACREIEAALARFDAERKVPSPEAIAAERHERDAEWQKLRAALDGAPLAVPQRQASVAAFERHLGEADRLADAALGDAKRVAEHAVQRRNLDAARSRQSEAEASLAAAETRESELEAQWREAFTVSGIEPLTPAEMAPWASQLASLIERRSLVEERRRSLIALQQEGEALRLPLREMALAAGLDVPDEAPDLIAARLATRLRSLGDAKQTAHGLAARIEASRLRIEELETLCGEAAGRADAWLSRFAGSLPKLGLAADATLDQVEAAIGAWGEVPDALRLIAREDRRIAGMRRDNQDFERHTAKLLTELAPDLAELPAQIAVKSLQERAAATAQAAARRSDCERRLVSASDAQRLAAATHAEAVSGLARLSLEAGLEAREQPTERLVTLLALLDRQAALAAELGDRRGKLIAAADGLDERAIAAELEGFDPASFDERLHALDQEAERLERDSKESFAAHVLKTQERAAREAGAGAELAAQKRSNAEGELARASRDWAVLKLGSLLLGRAIERHREAAHNPLMERAGSLFARLTSGAFTGLGSLYDEADMPLLVARRPAGAGLTLEALSEGTRDQLYLALRLAYVESYAARLEPPPFIADDIFVTFDDERSANGLEALAEIGEGLQCILFTHHRRIAELAAERLGERCDIIALDG